MDTVSAIQARIDMLLEILEYSADSEQPKIKNRIKTLQEIIEYV